MRTIIVCTTNYYPFIGGAEIAIEEIATRLKNDFRFVIVAARMDRKLPRKEYRPEGTIIRVGVGTPFDKWMLAFCGSIVIGWKLLFGEWRHLYRNREVCLFGVDISQGALAAAITSWFLPRVPFILNLQYGYGDERIAHGRGGSIRVALRCMLARADYVTAISQYLLRVARQYRYRGGAAIIPNGVTIDQFENKEGRKTHTYPTVITASRLVEKNGIDTLISAIAEVQKKIPEIRCVILGDGPDREKLAEQIHALHLESSVSLLGSIPNAEIPAYMHSADVFVRASRSEGMGIAFVEALAARLPIIGTPVGGIPDVIEDGKTGIFANVDDPLDVAEKIVRILSNADLADTIIAEGGKMVRERFSWERIAVSYRALFTTVGFPKKRVVIATPLLPPDIGGPATYVHALTEELPQSGVGIAVAYFGDVRALPKIIRHGAFFFNVLLKSRGKDIIFAQDPVSTGFPAFLVSVFLRKKFVLKIVGDYAWEQWQQNKTEKDFVSPEDFQDGRFDWKTETRRRIERRVAQSAATIIVPSNYLKKIIVRWGVREERVYVIPNAFDVEYDLSRYQKTKTMRSGKTLVTAGRLVPWKGFDTLIRLMPDILKKYPGSTLKIIGDGPMRGYFENLVKELNLQNTVIIVGAIPHKDFLGLLSQADLFVLNTGYEGLSHILLEAMVVGVPIVTTSVCGNPEVVEDGIEGVLVDYNDSAGILAAVERMFDRSDETKKMIENAKKKVERFSRETMIQNTKETLLT